jgi:hypothetical protein
MAPTARQIMTARSERRFRRYLRACRPTRILYRVRCLNLSLG